MVSVSYVVLLFTFSLTPDFIPRSWEVTSYSKEALLQYALRLLIALFMRRRLGKKKKDTHLHCLLMGAAS